MSRRAARIDTNQREIVQLFRDLGWTVQHLHAVGAGCPDLVVGGVLDGVRVNLLVEVKSGKGKLRDVQVEWHDGWRGQVCVVRTPEDVLELIGQGD